MNRNFGKYNDSPWKFAAYHVPLYPTHRKYELTGSVLGRKHWQPLFDKFNFQANFEHHDHTLKRTKPIRGNQIAAKGQGTTYFGDGCWGKGARSADASRWYVEKAMGVQHFWLVEVGEHQTDFTGISIKGEILDQHTLTR
jgi:hypothetical protein